MMMGSRRWAVLGCLGCALAATAAAVAVGLLSGPTLHAEESGGKSDPAVTRAREQVKMLDDLYKTAVVSITNAYDPRPPAIKVAKQIFGAMEKNGWHSARLVDASGAPLSDESLPKTPFEERAAEAMQEGKAYYEEIVGSGSERTLYAATVVPAVLKQCASCHGAEEGDLLGFIRYEVPVK